MNIVAIIPARGNSKSIKKKNLLKINGTPLLINAVKIIKKVKEINKIIVSSESEKILQLCSKYKIDTYKRPFKLSSDHTTSEDVVLDAIKKNNLFKDFEIAILCQCTSPMTKSIDILKAINLFKKKKFDSLFSGYSTDKIFWKKKRSNLKPINSSINTVRQPRQLRSKTTYFCENGAFYIFNLKKFLKKKNRFFGKIGIYKMNKYKSFEIDSLSDYNFIKKL